MELQSDVKIAVQCVMSMYKYLVHRQRMC